MLEWGLEYFVVDAVGSAPPAAGADMTGRCSLNSSMVSRAPVVVALKQRDGMGRLSCCVSESREVNDFHIGRSSCIEQALINVSQLRLSLINVARLKLDNRGELPT